MSKDSLRDNTCSQSPKNMRVAFDADGQFIPPPPFDIGDDMTAELAVELAQAQAEIEKLRAELRHAKTECVYWRREHDLMVELHKEGWKK